eukprot:m51a1_g5126 hypothetical protein (850) ;mRNA; f:390689-394307
MAFGAFALAIVVSVVAFAAGAVVCCLYGFPTLVAVSVIAASIVAAGPSVVWSFVTSLAVFLGGVAVVDDTDGVVWDAYDSHSGSSGKTAPVIVQRAQVPTASSSEYVTPVWDLYTAYVAAGRREASEGLAQPPWTDAARPSSQVPPFRAGLPSPCASPYTFSPGPSCLTASPFSTHGSPSSGEAVKQLPVEFGASFVREHEVCAVGERSRRRPRDIAEKAAKTHSSPQARPTAMSAKAKEMPRTEPRAGQAKSQTHSLSRAPLAPSPPSAVVSALPAAKEVDTAPASETTAESGVVGEHAREVVEGERASQKPTLDAGPVVPNEQTAALAIDAAVEEATQVMEDEPLGAPAAEMGLSPLEEVHQPPISVAGEAPQPPVEVPQRSSEAQVLAAESAWPSPAGPFSPQPQGLQAVSGWAPQLLSASYTVAAAPPLPQMAGEVPVQGAQSAWPTSAEAPIASPPLGLQFAPSALASLPLTALAIGAVLEEEEESPAADYAPRVYQTACQQQQAAAVSTWQTASQAAWEAQGVPAAQWGSFMASGVPSELMPLPDSASWASVAAIRSSAAQQQPTGVAFSGAAGTLTPQTAQIGASSEVTVQLQALADAQQQHVSVAASAETQKAGGAPAEDQTDPVATKRGLEELESSAGSSRRAKLRRTDQEPASEAPSTAVAAAAPAEAAQGVPPSPRPDRQEATGPRRVPERSRTPDNQPQIRRLRRSEPPARVAAPAAAVPAASVQSAAVASPIAEGQEASGVAAKRVLERPQSPDAQPPSTRVRTSEPSPPVAAASVATDTAAADTVAPAAAAPPTEAAAAVAETQVEGSQTASGDISGGLDDLELERYMDNNAEGA